MGIETRNSSRSATPKSTYRGRGRGNTSSNNISIHLQSPTRKPSRVVHSPIGKTITHSITSCKPQDNSGENSDSFRNTMDSQAINTAKTAIPNTDRPNPGLDLQSSVPPILDTQVVENPVVTANPNNNSNIFSMDALITIMQQTIQTTKEEFMKELATVRENISQIGSRNNSLDHNISSANRANGSTPTRHQIPQSAFSNVFHMNSSNAPDASSTLDNNVRLEKWKITYDGNSSVSDFIFKVETLTARSRCSENHLLYNFHVLLEGKAEKWYWLYTKQNSNVSYVSLRQAIIKEFGHLESDHDILLKITTRKQQMKESYDDFHTNIISMNARLRNPMSELTLIDIMKKNLSPNLKFLLFNSSPKSLDDLREIARNAEIILRDNKFYSPYFVSTRNISEIEPNPNDSDEVDSSDPQIEAIQFSKRISKPDYSGIKCWNCLKLGHSYIYCSEEIRSPFCFKCGQKGVLTPKCPNNHLQGNRKTGELAAGDTCLPYQTPSSRTN
ncbi:hypothetical protein CVS40_11803 [Lucilia cuprina]|nr:hypothetical protein CVS40_11803 [Lucilia cuprina]